MSEELVPPDFLVSPELFESYFVNRENYRTITNLALEGRLGSIRNRFIAWRIFLGILPENLSIDGWVARVHELREAHEKIVKSHRDVKTDHLDPLIFNPLSSASENPWNNFHVDNELKGTIRNDVQRTFQERLLFQMSSIQELMVSILFTWSKENSDLSYKQGMNELLAIVLFVAFAEKPPDSMNVPPKTQEYLNIINDPQYMEADVYWLFVRLMDLGIAELFNPVVSHRQVKKRNDLFTWEAEKTRNDLVNQDKSADDKVSSVLKRCHKIHHRILQSIDKELYMYLERQKIEPQMYLQRYLRCILSREFNLSDTLILWDALFARNCQGDGENGDLALMDYICVAMIVFVRAFVLQSDYSGILRRLLKFPPVEDVHILVSMAVSYQERMQGKDSKPVILTQPQETKVSTTAGPGFLGASKPQALTTPSLVLNSGSKTNFGPLAPNPVQSVTPTANKSPFRVDKTSQPTAARQVVTSSDLSHSSAFSDPLLRKTEQPKVENKGFVTKTEFKSSSPMRGPEAYVTKEEEKKEEKKVMARSENSFVEKCNTALLLLLEQSDEQVYVEEKMKKTLQVLMSLKEDITQEIAKKNADPLRKV